MANLIKIIIFLLILIGVGIYIFTKAPKFSEIIERIPGQKVFLKPTPKPAAPWPTYPTTPAPTISVEPEIPDYLIPAGFERKDLSLYFQKIQIASAYASFWNYTPDQIRISSYLNKGEAINITGWKIKGNRREVIIPRAINIYEPSGLMSEEDIILTANNYVNIYSSRSPINRNFRLNKCTGYLENTYNFYPSLPQNCPSIPRSEISHLSGQCQSYILSLWGCKAPDVSFYNSLPGTDEGNLCRQFLNTINHGTCFQKHRFDSDFLSNEWRVWIGQRIIPEDILDPQHDRLLLFDKQGLLVDEYTY
jgi:hypothetical protein